MRKESSDEGSRWLMQAIADRDGAEILFEGGSFHLACFIAQQVAEKALKAFLYSKGEQIVTGHSVETLAAWCSEYNPEFERLREEVAPLDGLYIPTRYPNGLPDSIPARVFTRKSAIEALRLTDLVLEKVRNYL